MFSQLIVFVVQLAAAYWVYNDARKSGLPQMKVMLWSLVTVVIPFPMCLLVVAVYYIVGKKGVKAAPKKDNSTIDIKAEVLPDDANKNATSEKCKMCGSDLPADSRTCAKCGTAK